VLPFPAIGLAAGNSRSLNPYAFVMELMLEQNRIRTLLVVSTLVSVGCGGSSDNGLFGGRRPVESDAGNGSGGSGTGGSGGSSIVPGGDCDVTGTWATFVEVGVEWQSATIKPGAGTTRQWILSQRSIADNGKLLDRAYACGIGAYNVPLGSPWFSIIDIPELGLLNEWTGVQFKKETFDMSRLPLVELYTTAKLAKPATVSVGDGFSTEAKPFLFGADGLAPDAEWPDVATLTPLAQAADHDGDGHSGITGVPFQGQVPGEEEGLVFRNPRLEVGTNPPQRAEMLYMAVRTTAALQGTIVDCDHLRIEGEVVPESLRIDSRIVGCDVAETGLPCTEGQVAFIDSNLPVFRPNGTSLMVSIKVPSQTTCADVREMDFGL
jgi:hypothetical protein